MTRPAPATAPRARVGALLVALLATVALLAGCGAPADDDAPGEAASPGLRTGTVGLLLPEAKTARYETSDHPTFVAVLEQLCPACRVLYANAAQDVAAQQEQAESMLARGVDRSMGAVRQPCRGQRREAHVVAQPAARLLEVRLDQVGELAVALGALARGGEQLGQALAGGGAPVLVDRRTCLLRQGGVAGDGVQVEQSRGGREILRGDLTALRDGAHRVVELQPGVPDRVPEALRELRDLLRRVGATVVDEHEVEVGARAGVAAAERADGSERDALGVGLGGLPVLAHAPQHELRDRVAAVLARDALPGQRGGQVGLLTLEVPHPSGVRDLVAVAVRGSARQALHA